MAIRVSEPLTMFVEIGGELALVDLVVVGDAWCAAGS